MSASLRLIYLELRKAIEQYAPLTEKAKLLSYLEELYKVASKYEKKIKIYNVSIQGVSRIMIHIPAEYNQLIKEKNLIGKKLKITVLHYDRPIAEFIGKICNVREKGYDRFRIYVPKKYWEELKKYKFEGGINLEIEILE